MLTFREIIQELFYEKTRAILIILAVVWGTFSIAIMLAIGEGLRLHFASVMANAGDNLLTISPGVTTKNYRGMHANEVIKFTKKDVEAIAVLPYVAEVSVEYKLDAKFRYRDQEVSQPLRAVSPKYAIIHNIKVGSKQRFISFLDMKNSNAVVVIGEKTADQLFPKENPIGNTIYIDNHPFVIVGVAQKKPQMSGTDMPDAWLNWIPSSTYELLNNPNKIDTIDVGYKNFALMGHTKDLIRKIIAIHRGADPSDLGIVDFRDLAKEQKETNDFFIRMQIFLSFIGGLTLFLAGVGITNVMYASVKRQTCQIGVQMALGATMRHIVSRYIIESLVVTIVGGIVGIIVALVVVYLIGLIPMQGFMIEEVFGKPKPVLSFFVITIVVVVLGITGFLAGLFPALKAAKIDPAEALTYE